MKTPKRKQRYYPGDVVRSSYRRPWIGVIEQVERWVRYDKYHYPIYRVRPIVDPTGRPQPKSVKSMTLAQDWLHPVEPPSVLNVYEHRTGRQKTNSVRAAAQAEVLNPQREVRAEACQ
jgi:hypothetical protein